MSSAQTPCDTGLPLLSADATASHRVVYRKSWMLYFMAMIGLVGGTLAYGVGGPLCLLGRIFPPARRVGARIIQKGIWLLMFLEPWFNADIRLSLPARALTVSNHRSHLDSFVLLSRVAGIRFLCKHTLFYIPFLGMMMRILRQIPVRRGDAASYWKAMEKIRAGLLQGDAVHVFPEMTRCSRGYRGTQPFHLAPFHVAFQEGVPVVPIVIAGTDEVWPKGIFGLRFGYPINVVALEAVQPAAFPNASELAAEVRRRIDRGLQNLLPAETGANR